MIELLIGKLLDWPFLAFLLIILFFRLFSSAIRDRIGSVVEMTIGGNTKIVLGIKQIEAADIGKELTETLRALEERVEAIEGKVSPKPGVETISADGTPDIPGGLQELLWKLVYPMLNSDLWYARHVDTLAKNTSTSPELMEKFLRSRPEVDVFLDGNKVAAGLKSRSSSRK